MILVVATILMCWGIDVLMCCALSFCILLPTVNLQNCKLNSCRLIEVGVTHYLKAVIDVSSPGVTVAFRVLCPSFTTYSDGKKESDLLSEL